jgi:hypothetical protein
MRHHPWHSGSVRRAILVFEKGEAAQTNVLPIFLRYRPVLGRVRGVYRNARFSPMGSSGRVA